MLKGFVTKKAVRENYGYVFRVPYCNMQSLLRGVEPFGYHAGNYGWNCDFYDIPTNTGCHVCISTGYRPTGITTNKSFLCKSFEEEAHNLWSRPLPYEQNRKDVNALLQKLVSMLVYLTDTGALK